jgi:hypothetical protein
MGKHKDIIDVLLEAAVLTRSAGDGIWAANISGFDLMRAAEEIRHMRQVGGAITPGDSFADIREQTKGHAA